jgi:glycolate oxidase FAD binding subunit
MAYIELAPGYDDTAALVARVCAASASKLPLRIVGGDTKRCYGRQVTGEPLHVASHRGVLRYDPGELVISARCGTPLLEVEALLAGQGQCLPFEPPSFGAGATLGGMVAAGLAGPARVARGPVRDYVLGATLLTGDGRVLKFGGEVMKNVAGYDVSRLLAGSLGILGILLDVSLKVLPAPVSTRTVRLRIDAAAAIARLTEATQQGLPVSASFWHDGELTVRLEGSAAGLAAVAGALGGAPIAEVEAVSFWRDVREQRRSFFAGAKSLWRLALPTTTAAEALVGMESAAVEWNGAQAWLADVDREVVERVARAAGGHATLFRRAHPEAPEPGEVFAPLSPGLMDLHRSVKRVFDPAGILNPGRMYAEL